MNLASYKQYNQDKMGVKFGYSKCTLVKYASISLKAIFLSYLIELCMKLHGLLYVT